MNQALKISCLETKRHKSVEIPDAPTYYPSEEEFKDPIQYIDRSRMKYTYFYEKFELTKNSFAKTYMGKKYSK